MTLKLKPVCEHLGSPSRSLEKVLQKGGRGAVSALSVANWEPSVYQIPDIFLVVGVQRVLAVSGASS